MTLQRFIEYENSKMYFILYTSLQFKVGHDVITVINCSVKLVHCNSESGLKRLRIKNTWRDSSKLEGINHLT